MSIAPSPAKAASSLSSSPQGPGRAGLSADLAGVLAGRDPGLEALTRAYGQDLFARLERPGPVLFSPGWWDDRLMEATMSDEAIKIQLFRFIDVLPQLNDPAALVRHLREYFAEAGTHLPPVLRFGLRWLPSRGLLGRLLARVARGSAEHLARRFIAGSTPDEAVRAVTALRRRSLAFTVDLLGEATVTEPEAEAYQRAYLELLAGLGDHARHWRPVQLIDRDDAGPLPRVNVSVKLSSLFSQFDPIDPGGTTRAVLARLRPILRLAREQRAFVNVDMEQYAFKDLTIRIFKEVLLEDEFRGWPDVGIAIQAYLRDSDADLHDLLEFVGRRGSPVTVRLVKGAYWDFETVVAAQQGWPVPVFTAKSETDAAYERLTRFLMTHHTRLRPALGSHNIRSLAHGLAVADTLGLPPAAYEFQLLYGMADPIKDALVGLGRRVRVYTPYGRLLPGMAYLVRRLLENTANDSFLRASQTDHVPEEVLLMNPLDKRPRPDPGRPQPPVTPAGTDGHRPSPTAVIRNEPLTNFSLPQSLGLAEKAMQEVRARFGATYPPVVNGRPLTTPATMPARNPSNHRETLGEIGRSTPAQAVEAVKAAADAFPGWRDTPVAQRADYLVKAAAGMRRRRYELAAWMVYECGKDFREADADVAEAIDYCDYYAREMLRLSSPVRRDVPGEDNEYFYDPRGVTAVIAPWNFPLAILCGMTAAALVTGNTAVMKPAEQSSLIGAQLMSVFQEAGLPPGVVNFLPGVGEEVGPPLVTHPDVAVVAFTGSRDVGLLLNRVCAETTPGQSQVKRVIAEMGGKNALIVDADADLDEAVRGVLASAFGYQGQKCSACSRAVVVAEIYDQFLARLVDATRGLEVGPADDLAKICPVGPVIDAAARDRILAYIETGKKEARLAYGADLPAGLADRGFYVGPHVFADVPPAARIATEEIFGPVLCVMKAADVGEALRIANGTDFALTGGLYSRSPETIARVRREFRVGNLYINRKITGALVDRQPFGGFKMSGIGSKAGGPDYLLQFVLPRTITENTVRRGFAPVRE